MQLVALLALVPQSVLVVDAGGSPGSFPDLPAAVAAASPGDVLDVRPGAYTRLDIEQPLTVVFRPGATVGDARVRWTPAGSTTILAGVEARAFRAVDCEGTVLFQDPVHRGLSPSKFALAVEECDDVRVHAFGVPATLSAASAGAFLHRSRVELVDVAVSASFPGSSDGLWALPGTSLFLAEPDVMGAPGGSQNGQFNCTGIPAEPWGAGDGGSGIGAFDAFVFLAGSPTSRVAGGPGGVHPFAPWCDGLPGPSVSAFGGGLRASGVQLVGSVLLSGGGTSMSPGPADPVLLATPAGALVVHGPVGAQVHLTDAAAPSLDRVPGVFMEQLVAPGPAAALGVIPATGALVHTPSSLSGGPLGATRWFQAAVTLSSGEIRLTNSLAHVSR